MQKACLYFVVYTLYAFVVIEYGVKEIWLRPRPGQTTLFGSTHEFLPIFHSLPSGNFRSFVSGHTAAWFGLICVGYNIYPTNHFFWTILSLLVGITMGLLRICVGKHFLSDIVFAGLFVATSCVILEMFITRFFGTAAPT
ncbi:phosphatase PAP2 family protein [Candidatus Paracaedibacter symbiosus]|uniref:phosphatase PAP2 family protein n=1 Tax=Candidatus Paracaedibacter symbiosus TaxID=244582 RepID=UPI000509F21D|nr:phosphatase PAP2 family protein [Candidatus Paracaedibacter symbiosus]